MKTLIIAATLALTSTSAMAQYYNSQRYGGTTYYYGSNGYNGNSQTYGSQDYYRDNRGNNCVTQRYGNQSYTNCY